MFSKSKISQSMIDAVNNVLVQTKPEPVQEVKTPEEGGRVPFAPATLTEASDKVPTPTGMKVYGSSYGNSKKARADQLKRPVDDAKGPKDSEMKEELKGDQHKIDANHNGEIDGQDFKILKGKKKVKESMSFADKLLETVRKSDIPAYLRKAKGDTPLTVADVKGPKKDSISAPENLAKAKNEWKEETEQVEEASEYEASDAAITTDTLVGRVAGGKTNSFKSFKSRVKALDKEGDGSSKEPECVEPESTAARRSIKAEEMVPEATIAGTPGWKEMKKDVKDKSGAVHTPMSRAKDLARSAFKKIQKEIK